VLVPENVYNVAAMISVVDIKSQPSNLISAPRAD
jgi:hypothetical protein